jgi:hypothetical protein
MGKILIFNNEKGLVEKLNCRRLGLVLGVCIVVVRRSRLVGSGLGWSLAVF